MRGRKVISLVALLMVVLAASAVFASGIVDVSKFSLLGSPGTVEPLSPGTSVFINPRWYIKDYPLQPIGSKFTVHVNISDVADLYTWHVNVTFDKSILNVNKPTAGEFLKRSDNDTASEELTEYYGVPVMVNSTDNTKGYSGFAESILGEISGITEAGTGRLASIEFNVVGYGRTNLVITLLGDFGTKLLDSNETSITFTKTDGYFDNRIPGDITGPENPPGSGLYPPDRKVDGADLTLLSKKFGTSDPVADWTGPENPPGSGTYPPDGSVDGAELTSMSKNFGRSV